MELKIKRVCDKEGNQNQRTSDKLQRLDALRELQQLRASAVTTQLRILTPQLTQNLDSPCTATVIH
jgi:hypothetical protein